MGKTVTLSSIIVIAAAAAFWSATSAQEVVMRKSPIAGSWYPGTKERLQETVNGLLRNAALPALAGRPVAVVSPHAGMQYSGQAAAYGFKALQNKPVSRVMLLGPSHYTYLHGIATSGVDGYETPLGVVPVDRAISDALQQSRLFQGPRSAERREHSLEMQLPFLQVVLKQFTLVPLVVGELAPGDYEEAAAALRPYLDEQTVIVASSDFTHYGTRFGYLPFQDNVKKNLEKLDGDAIKKIVAKDFDGFLHYLDATGATICGSRPIGLLMKLLPPGATGTLLTYYTSGDILNDYTDTVSYASILFTVPVKQ